MKRIVVSDLENDTFYAKIILEFGDSTPENNKIVDSRPSDAIALAVRTNVPIFVEEPVLEKAGVQLDNDASTTGVEDVMAAERDSEPPGEEELKGMSAFTEFVEGLDLGDLERGASS